MTSVKLTDVSLDYPVYELTGRSLKVSVIRQVAGARLILSSGSANVRALSNISLSLREGDRLGLVGHNGSGKSTLLRVIAGVAHPQRGKVETIGRVIPLIDRAMGINADLNGFENIELPLRLLGATSAEVAAAKKDIPEWTGLGQFMNLPVRTYSDGMRARLSFALCTAVPGDILVLDEWLSAGDAAFIEQAHARIADYVSRSKILVLASHSSEMIEQVCNVTAWMERGEVRAIGPTSEILPLYLEAMHQSAAITEQSRILGQRSEFA